MLEFKSLSPIFLCLSSFLFLGINFYIRSREEIAILNSLQLCIDGGTITVLAEFEGFQELLITKGEFEFRIQQSFSKNHSSIKVFHDKQVVYQKNSGDLMPQHYIKLAAIIKNKMAKNH